MILRSTRALLTLATIATVPALADVKVVGPGQPFTSIQVAVSSASPGDIVLVKSGTYGGFTIDGVAVSVVADVGQIVMVTAGTGSIGVQNIPAGSFVSLSGLSARSLSASSMLGSLRVNGVHLDGFSVLVPAARLENCADVAFSSCQITGAPGVPNSQASSGGIRVQSSKMALLGCSITGGWGSPGVPTGFGNTTGGPGGVGLAVVDAEVFVSGCTIEGGVGGDGAFGTCSGGSFPSGGGDGGTGLLVSGASSIVRRLDSTFVGGAGGFGGGIPGSGCAAGDGSMGTNEVVNGGVVSTLPGSSRQMHRLDVVREGASLSVRVDGPVGDRIYLGAATATGHVFQPSVNGVQLYAGPARRIFLGTIGGSGFVTAALPIPNLPAGVLSITRQLQAVAVDASNQTWFSSSDVLVMLDSSL